MARSETRSDGITNYVVPVPGSTVTAFLGVRDSDPTEWIYSLWTGRGPGGEGEPVELLATDAVVIPAEVDVTPEQVARIAFLLEVEYAS